MPYLQLDQQRLFYARQGKRPGAPAGLPNVVLIHGAASSHLDWPAALRRLPEATVYVPDLPGHGRSAGPGRDSISAYAATITQFMAALALEKVVLVGHSMGGAIALHIGQQPPPQVVGLVIVGSGAWLPVSPAILDHVQDDFAATMGRIAHYEWAKDAPAGLREAGRARLLQNAPSTVYHDLLACAHFDLRPQLGRIQLPTLVIAGEADRMTPLALSQQLVEGLPQAELLVVPGGGHMMALEQPELVAQAVEQFVARLAHQAAGRGA